MKTKTRINRLVEVFDNAESPLLNIFFTAGFPNLEDTGVIARALQDADVDMIEIGMPFSDPLADGPVISESSMTALENGMTLELLFEQLDTIDFEVPVVLMGYFNPVLQYGVRRFCERCARAGISGLIIPDLPLELYQSQYVGIFEEFNLCNIGMVTPATSVERIKWIDAHCSGFVYAVSSASTTGTKGRMADVDEYLAGLAAMRLNNPVMTGFNIRDRESFERASKHTAGGIIGSAYISTISNADNIENSTSEFIKSIRP